MKYPKNGHNSNKTAKTESLSAATVHGHVRTLRAFFNWLKAEGLIELNPSRQLKTTQGMSEDCIHYSQMKK